MGFHIFRGPASMFDSVGPGLVHSDDLMPTRSPPPSPWDEGPPAYPPGAMEQPARRRRGGWQDFLIGFFGGPQAAQLMGQRRLARDQAERQAEQEGRRMEAAGNLGFSKDQINAMTADDLSRVVRERSIDKPLMGDGAGLYDGAGAGDAGAGPSAAPEAEKPSEAQLRASADDAIRRGADPAEVLRRYQQRLWLKGRKPEEFIREL